MEVKIKQSSKDIDEYITQTILQLVHQLDIHPDIDEPEHIKNSRTQEWANISFLRLHLELFLTYDRKKLIPIKKITPNSNLFRVRFFDRDNSSFSGDDTVAVLYQTHAQKLTDDLENIVENIREKNKIFVELLKSEKKIEKELKFMLEKLFESFDVMGFPMGGSCYLCANSSFLPSSVIMDNNRKIDEIPEIVSYPMNNDKKSKLQHDFSDKTLQDSE